MLGLYLSEDLITALRRGELTTCESSARLHEIDPELVPSRLDAVGKKFDVMDEDGKSRARAKLVACFLTTFGKPDERLAVDAERWKADYAKFWSANFPDEPLDPTTELFVCRWAVL